MRKVNIKSTSNKTADLSTIILSESELIRVSFEPTIIDNSHDSDKSVKGKLIYQKQRKKEPFKELSRLSRKDMRVGDWMEIQLDSTETYNLFNGLSSCYKIYNEKGIPIGEEDCVIVYKEYENIINLLESKENLLEKILSDENQIISKIFEFISNENYSEELVNKLVNMDIDELDNISASINISKIQKILNQWDQNWENSNEEYWQELFQNNTWVLSECFKTPTLFFEKKAYLGGKSFNNRGGNIIDLLFKNDLTNNISLIELKTPMTEIIKEKYRNTYTFSKDLVGGISQVLNYRDSILKEFHSLQSSVDSDIEVVNPKCLLIIGNVSKLNSEEKKAFDNYRNELKSVEVLGYDEVNSKIKSILELLKV